MVVVVLPIAVGTPSNLGAKLHILAVLLLGLLYVLIVRKGAPEVLAANTSAVYALWPLSEPERSTPLGVTLAIATTST